MKTYYLASEFSLSMLPVGGELRVTRINRRELDDALDLVRYAFITDDNGDTIVIANPHLICAVGHEGTARALGVGVSRIAILLQKGDILYVAQPTGSRLAVGSEISEPELSYFRVEIRGRIHDFDR